MKTADDTGRKVFINICSSEKVQPPESWEDGVMPDSVKKSLENMEELENSQDVQALRIPLSLSEQRNDFDKHGQECTVFDCVFADKVINEAANFRPMKVFVIECAMGWIQHKCKLQLDPKFKLPKLKYKGDVIHEHRVRKQQKSLVTEVTEITQGEDEEPAVALCSRKAVKSVEQVASGGKQPAAAAQSEHIKPRGTRYYKLLPRNSIKLYAMACACHGLCLQLESCHLNPRGTRAPKLLLLQARTYRNQKLLRRKWPLCRRQQLNCWMCCTSGNLASRSSYPSASGARSTRRTCSPWSRQTWTVYM